MRDNGAKSKSVYYQLYLHRVMTAQKTLEAFTNEHEELQLLGRISLAWGKSSKVQAQLVASIIK